MSRVLITFIVALLVLTALPALASAAKSTVSLVAVDKTCSEDTLLNDKAVFRISRTSPTTSGLVVYYEICGTAKNGVDYNSITGKIAIPKGKRYIDLKITPKEDHTPEATETIILTLKSSASYAYILGSTSTRKATISIKDESTNPYQVTVVKDGLRTEYRLYYQENYQKHHFMTIINDNGAFVARPHPGVDVNGWGTSPYIQPFLPGATLRHTAAPQVTAEADKVVVKTSGLVSKDSSSSVGTWDTQLNFSYDKENKQITGEGNYNIHLANSPAELNADINLMKIASNYLRNVPLLDNTTGDTGDMEYSTTTSSLSDMTWVPWQQPAHFPWDKSDFFDITLVGDYYNLDSAAQGYAAIKPAYKPTVRIRLESTNTTGLDMITGYIFDESKSQMFWEDNIGITPLIIKTSNIKDYSFSIEYESTALPGDRS